RRMIDPEIVALLRKGANAYSERGIDALAENWDEEVVYEEDPLWPGAGTHRGRQAVVARLREYEEQLGRSTVTVEETIERRAGLVVIFRNFGVTPGSGVPFDHRWAWLLQVRDGKTTHIRA